MKAILCDQTALNFWRSRSEPIGSVPSDRACLPERRGVVDHDVPSAAIVSELRTWGLVGEDEVHLLVTSADKRRRLKGVNFTVISNPVPQGSFERAMGQVYVVSPEMLFVQLAGELPLVELLEIGYELCGTYRMIDGQPSYNLAPLTSASKLKSYAQRAKGLRGRAAALQALSWIIDGSASPAETALAIAFKLPLRLGGCALGDFELNQELELNEGAARILGRSSMHPDFYWPRGKHPAEYDSSLYHASREQAEYDERRRNAYGAMGMNVTIFTPRHLVDLELFDQMVTSIRHFAGIRLQAVPQGYDALHSERLHQTFRYWFDLKDNFGLGDDFVERASAWDAPSTDW